MAAVSEGAPLLRPWTKDAQLAVSTTASGG
jgi:hypothetical protein